MSSIIAARFDSPLDEMVAAVDEAGALVVLKFADGRPIDSLLDGVGDVTWDASKFSQVKRQLDEYFRGKREVFDLPLDPPGTPFQKEAWARVREIPYGETRSYGEVAADLGRRGASRAVGRANATNPVCLVTPCHRVIGADGSLTGFGGGIETKRRLLALESRQLTLGG